MDAHPDPDLVGEWVDSLDALCESLGPDQAGSLLSALNRHAATKRLPTPASVTTAYRNTIDATVQPPYPGDLEIEKRIRAIIRWNAVVMVDRANRRHDGLGGHLATFASAATLYDVGFHHFFAATPSGFGADQVFIQGHAAPGIYARAFLEGRLGVDDLDRFRRETLGGLPSYPHPRRTPQLWQFPTVSMGLGVMGAVHQARMNRYLAAQGLIEDRSRVWCFAGDGEMDEPESTASLALAAREGLDNLTMVVNCNLQRLDGPVRGGSKVIQELEGRFRGAGWNVIKVVWGGAWDELLARDDHGLLAARMESACDGDYQKYSVSEGAFIREHFFGTDPRLAALVAHLSDDDLYHLPRGGHDPEKVHAAYAAAVAHRGAPTAVLVKTVKGWALGGGVEARNAAHQVKKLDATAYRGLRDRLDLPIADSELGFDEPRYFHPGEHSPEVEYLRARRRALGGVLPRRVVAPGAALPGASQRCFTELEAGSKDLAASTTAAAARLVRELMRDEPMGRAVVPIVADEARTFGLDSLFATHGIYTPGGQRYEPVDAGLALSYREAADGRLLQEGISEAAALCDFTALATAYSTWGASVVPFYFYYSMFGFQRVGDQIWQAGDQRARGFLLGATAGRTTLAGEGLQHCDGHSLLIASAHPSVRSYDCAYGYELAAVVRSGLAEMADRDVIYYLTLYNEAYPQPARPEGLLDADVTRGAYLVSGTEDPVVRICASGPLVREALSAQRSLARRQIAAEVWSVTSWTELAREARDVERRNALHPLETPHVSLATQLLGDLPVVALTDWVRAVPEQVARFVGPMEVLGTDGWGLSDTRADLRRHFEIDARFAQLAALRALGEPASAQQALINELGIDAARPAPSAADPAARR